MRHDKYWSWQLTFHLLHITPKLFFFQWHILVLPIVKYHCNFSDIEGQPIRRQASQAWISGLLWHAAGFLSWKSNKKYLLLGAWGRPSPTMLSDSIMWGKKTKKERLDVLQHINATVFHIKMSTVFFNSDTILGKQDKHDSYERKQMYDNTVRWKEKKKS